MELAPHGCGLWAAVSPQPLAVNPFLLFGNPWLVTLSTLSHLAIQSEGQAIRLACILDGRNEKLSIVLHLYWKSALGSPWKRLQDNQPRPKWNRMIMKQSLTRSHFLPFRFGIALNAVVVTLSCLVAVVGMQVARSSRAQAVGSLTPTIPNLPSSAFVGGSFTPVVSTSSRGSTSVTSLTPSICRVNQDGSVSYLSVGRCSLRSHVAASQTTIGSGFATPGDVAVDASGNVYVADTSNNRVVEVSPTGTQTTIGSGFLTPYGVAVDASGNVYVADTSNNRVVEVSPTGTQTTIGSGFSFPHGVAVDASGNVYVADTQNNQVWQVTPSGSEYTVGGGYHHPSAVAVDASGNVYVADTSNNQVEKITPTQNQTTIGTGFSSPFGVAVDASGNVFVGDYGNNQVKEVGPTGTQTTLGSGFSAPSGIAVDATGNLYVADAFNSRVVKLSPALDGVSQSLVIQAHKPSAPTQARAVADGSSVVILWHAPVSSGGSSISRYRVSLSPSGKSCTTSRLTCTIRGLNPEKSYTLSITATNAAGIGPAATLRHVKG